MTKTKFKLTIRDTLTEKKISGLQQIVKLAEKLKKQQTQEERKKTEEEIRKLIIKPEISEQIAGSISQLVKTEVEHSALPGYNYEREENTELQKETEEITTPKIRKSIEKQEVIQNVLLVYFKLNENDLALNDSEMIRKLDPECKYIKGHYLYGLTLMRLKKYKDAATAFQLVIKLDPEYKKATDRLNECLKEQKSEPQGTELPTEDSNGIESEV